MARIAGDFAYHVPTSNYRSISQDTKSREHHFWGFDYDGKFQMVLVGKTVCLHAQHADIHTMELVPDAAMQSLCGGEYRFGVDTSDIYDLDKSRDYCIYLWPKSAGTGRVRLRIEKTNATIDEVEVQVVTERKVKVQFYSLNDHERRGFPRERQAISPYSNGQGLEEVLWYVHTIVKLQAGVSIDLVGKHQPLEVVDCFNDDFGQSPNLFRILGQVRGKPGWEAGANWHVVWIWDSDDVGERAWTFGDVTFLKRSKIGGLAVNNPFELAKTIAHEMVHHLCGARGAAGSEDHDGNESDLMFRTHPHGVMLRKSRLKKIIR